MPKFAVMLAQLVRETAIVIVEAPSKKVLEENLSNVYQEEDGDVDWGIDGGCPIKEGTHQLLAKEKAYAQVHFADFIMDADGLVTKATKPT